MNPSTPFDTTQVCFGGRWRAGDSGQTLPLLNPSDGSVLAHIARGEPQAMWTPPCRPRKRRWTANGAR